MHQAILSRASRNSKIISELNKHKFKKQMQTGGANKKENKNNVMTIEKAVKLLNDVYN